jgi:FlgD Ig-like domain
VDGYHDVFRPTVRVDEGGSLWLEIFNHTGAAVRTIAHPHARAGTFTLTWNGRNAAGRLVGAGRFHYRFVAQHPGSRRVSSRLSEVTVSRRRLVLRIRTLSQRGDRGVAFSWPGAPSCAGFSRDASAFRGGLWVANICRPKSYPNEHVVVAYTFTVPHAVHYHRIRLAVFGQTHLHGSRLTGMIYNDSSRAWEQRTVTLTSPAPTDTTLNGASGNTTVNPAHKVRVSIQIPFARSGGEYDIGTVSVRIPYDVLA